MPLLTSVTGSFVYLKYDPPIIPAGAMIMYNGTDPGLTGWSRYSTADGYYINGASTQGEIGTTTGAGGTFSATYSVGAAGDHSGSGYNILSSIYSGVICLGNGITAGSHSHSFSVTGSAGSMRPYSTSMTLLYATTDQYIFPSGTIHMHSSNAGSSWTQKLATTDVRYIVGGASGTVDTGMIGGSGSGTSSSGGTHTHYGSSTQSSSSPLPSTYTSSGNAGQAHAHSASPAAYITRLTGKLLKLWIAASNDMALNNHVVMFVGDLSTLPSYWKLCDGTNGTLDLRSYYLGYSTVSGTAHDTATAQYGYVDTAYLSATWTHQHNSGLDIGTASYTRNIPHSSSSNAHMHICDAVFDAPFSGYNPGSIKVAFIQYVS